MPGASDLMSQVANETDEERRKRLLAAQQQRLLPSLTGTPGASSLGLQLTGYGAGAGTSGR